MEDRDGGIVDRVDDDAGRRFLHPVEFRVAEVAAGDFEAEVRERLAEGFNPAAIPGVMCRNTISISWDGRLFDCDFNQMLDLDAAPASAMTIETFDFSAWQDRNVVTERIALGAQRTREVRAEDLRRDVIESSR